MNIALIAHDRKKELMVDFCMAYKSILSKHKIYATGTTGNLIQGMAGLELTKFLPGPMGGTQQIGSLIECNEIDMLIMFRDQSSDVHFEREMDFLINLCDFNNIPVATNIATAEVLVNGLQRGDLDWRYLIEK